MRLPNAERAVVDRSKIVDYLLAEEHEDGRGKPLGLVRCAPIDPTYVSSEAKRMINEHDRVALDRDLPEFGLTKGDLGTVVHIYADGKAYEVEFMTLSGDTIGVVTLETSDVRPTTDREIAHARSVA